MDLDFFFNLSKIILRQINFGLLYQPKKCYLIQLFFSLQIPSFNGKSSHLIFAGLAQKSPLWNDFELVIRPTEDNGLILYNGDRSNPNGDFVAVFLSQGYIEFAFDAGDGATVVRY